MALPVLTPGKRRRSRLPLVAAVVVLAALVLAGVLEARSRGHHRAARRASPPAAAARRTARTTAAPKRRRASTRPQLAAARAPLLVGAGSRHVHPFRPRLGARGAILVNERTGAVLWALDPYRRLPIASTTKIMTAIIALQRLRPTRVVTVSKLVPRVPLVREGLRAGERVPASKLLYALLLYSGNDDALALAQATAGSRKGFLRLMNERARSLGLRATHFTSPSGVIDRGNFSTAWDLASIARYALRDPRFRAIVRTRVKRVPWPAPTFSKIYVNKNALLTTYRGADGVKTGWTTKARHCLVASAHRRGIHLLAVVLGSPDAFTDARRLLDYGFRLNGR